MKRHPLIATVAIVAAVLTGCSTNSSRSTDTTAAATATTVVDSSVAANGDTSPVGASETTNAVIADTTIAATNDTTVASAAGATPPATALTATSVDPGQSGDKFVGAASDVTTTSCAQSGSAWKAEGTVSNTSGARASYRIYVAFNVKGTTDTKALVQTNVDVDDGQTTAWSAKANVNADDLICILRVERTAAG